MYLEISLLVGGLFFLVVALANLFQHMAMDNPVFSDVPVSTTLLLIAFAFFLLGTHAVLAGMLWKAPIDYAGMLINAKMFIDGV